MCSFIVILAVLFVLTTPSECISARFFFTLGPELRYVNGNSTYHIRFDNPWAAGGHGESELEFPLDNFMAGIHVTVGTRYEKSGTQTKGRLGLSLLAVVDDDAGIMEDSDWIENDAAFGEAPHEGRDSYTESDAELRGNIIDLNYVYYFRIDKSWTLGPMLGFRYQELKYDIYGYRGIYWTTPVYGEGEFLDYRVTYEIPYVGVASEGKLGEKYQLHLTIALGYSNWAEARDRDYHVPRSKLSEAVCKGEAYLASVGLDWGFLPRWIFGASLEYVDIDTTGKQHQRFYAGPFVGTTYEVDDTITSSVWAGVVRVTYAF